MKKKLINHFWLDSGGPTYNAYVSAYISNLGTRGFTVPDSTRLNAMNTFIDSIGVTIMGKIDLMRLMALNNTGLSDASRVNMIAPASYLADYVNAINYTTKGPQGDGVSAYIDNNFNCSTNGVNYTLNSAGRIIYVETVPSVGVRLDGNGTLSTNSIIYGSGATSNLRINSNNNLSANFSTTGTGLKAIMRSDSTNVECYNETTRTSLTQTSSATPNEDQFILRNTTNYSDACIGLYLITGYLTESEVQAIRTHYLTYRTAIGL